jgi:hypothetical protein
VVKRGALFVGWALVGLVLSYGALYAFTPFGLLIIAACLLVARLLPAVRGSRWPEVLGLMAGPGLFCFVVARNAGDPGGWAAAGVAIVGVAMFAYALAGRALCARSV